MISNEDEARDFCRARTDAAGFGRLERFCGLLASENERQNLVSTGSLAEGWRRHIADSMQLLDYVSRETRSWLDLGTGAGFPGLVTAIARPEFPIVLVESRKRRVEWLQQVIEALELRTCRVIGSRVENVETFEAGIISARAFAPLGKLLALSARFSTHDTVWLLPKGRSAAQELQEQSEAVRQVFHVEQSQTDEAGGILLGKGTPDLR